MLSLEDRKQMVRALELAALGLNTTTPNPRVGCVITDSNGAIIGEGYHKVAGQPHAEINALSDVKSRGHLTEGATAYVTLEPCSHFGRTGPCAQALVDAKLARVVYGMEDPNPEVAGRGLNILLDAGIDVVGPLFEDDARALNKGFIKRMTQGRPFVRCKMAMSLDGRTAMDSGESKWITGPSARQDVQKIRARSCAIITGVDSVIHDDPALTVRINEGDRQPLRVIVDTHARCPLKADILNQPGNTVVVIGESTAVPDDGREYWILPEKNGHVSLNALIRKLAEEGCNEVLVESGAKLAGAFVAEGLVDEFVVYMAAKLMGSNARPLFQLPIHKMSGQLPLIIQDVRRVGEDWRFTAIPDPEG